MNSRGNMDKELIYDNIIFVQMQSMNKYSNPTFKLLKSKLQLQSRKQYLSNSI